VTAARDLDPLAADVVAYDAWLAWYQRADATALQLMERSAALDANAARARAFNAFVFAAMGDCDLARAALDRLERAADAFPLVPEASFAAARCVNDRTLVDTVSRELAANQKTFALAMLHFGLGDRDRFFELLRQAEAESDPQVLWVGVDPALTAVHDDPRLRAFLSGLGLD